MIWLRLNVKVAALSLADSREKVGLGVISVAELTDLILIRDVIFISQTCNTQN